MIYCNFINNSANYGGGVCWDANGINGILIGCTFVGNFNVTSGGGVIWYGANGTIKDSTFENNYANAGGGGIRWIGTNGTLIDSTFISNSAIYYGGAISWSRNGFIVNCSFVNSKWINSKYNGIHARENLTINGGKGIVDTYIDGTLTGISIVVLNNETYYYPPNTNINFTDKFKTREVGNDKIINRTYNYLSGNI